MARFSDVSWRFYRPIIATDARVRKIAQRSHHPAGYLPPKILKT